MKKDCAGMFMHEMNRKGKVRVVKRSEVLGNEGIYKKHPVVGQAKDFSVKKFHLIQTKYIMLIKQI